MVPYCAPTITSWPTLCSRLSDASSRCPQLLEGVVVGVGLVVGLVVEVVPEDVVGDGTDVVAVVPPPRRSLRRARRQRPERQHGHGGDDGTV